MEYTLNRYEKNRNHEGDIVSIFLVVSVSDSTNNSYFEHWCSQEEMEAILLDESNLKPILENCYAQCELKMENEIATRPKPAIKPLEEEGKKDTLEALVKVKDIAIEKTAILAEIELAEAEKLAEEVKPLEEIIP